MRRQPRGLYAIALAILMAGLVALGVPAGALLVAAFVLACPLMMLFMMRPMHGGESTQHRGETPDYRPTTRPITTTSAGNDAVRTVEGDHNDVLGQWHERLGHAVHDR